MRLLPTNPKTRNIILLLTLAAVVLGAFVYAYVVYFFPEDGQTLQVEDIRKKVSEATVRAIEKDITDIEKELNDPFYAGLKKYTWTADAAPAGNKNPFSQ